MSGAMADGMTVIDCRTPVWRRLSSPGRLASDMAPIGRLDLNDLGKRSSLNETILPDSKT